MAENLLFESFWQLNSIVLRNPYHKTWRFACCRLVVAAAVPVHQTETVDAEKTSVVPQFPSPQCYLLPRPDVELVGRKAKSSKDQLSQAKSKRYQRIPKVRRLPEFSSSLPYPKIGWHNQQWLGILGAKPGQPGLQWLCQHLQRQHCSIWGWESENSGKKRWETARSIKRHVKECKQQPNWNRHVRITSQNN